MGNTFLYHFSSISVLVWGFRTDSFSPNLKNCGKNATHLSWTICHLDMLEEVTAFTIYFRELAFWVMEAKMSWLRRVRLLGVVLVNAGLLLKSIFWDSLSTKKCLGINSHQLYKNPNLKTYIESYNTKSFWSSNLFKIKPRLF